MKLIISTIFAFFLTFIFYSIKVNAVGYLDDKKIYNIEVGDKFIVYEYEEIVNNQPIHYLGYYDTLRDKFTKITNINGENIDSDILFPSISKDDKYISFTSKAINITSDKVGKCFDVINNIYETCSNIYIYNISKKNFEMVKNGNEILNGNSYISKISGDGSSIVFESSATNNLNFAKFQKCIFNRENICVNIFKYDIFSKAITLISSNRDNYGGDSNSISPSISGDGRYVTFQSNSTNFLENYEDLKTCKNVSEEDEILCSHIYLVDTKKMNIKLISRSEYGVFNDNSGNSYISDDSRYIYYESYATNIEDRSNNKRHIILYDMLNSNNTILSKQGSILNNRDTYLKDISQNGKFIVVESKSTNLNGRGENSLYIYNIESKKMALIDNCLSTNVIAKISGKYLYFYGDSLFYKKMDIEPPIIEKNQEIYVVKNSFLELENRVNVNDNLFDSSEIVIHLNDNLLLNSVGEYYVDITAYDFFENFSTEKIKIIVVEKDDEGPIFSDTGQIRVLKGTSTLNLSNYISAFDKIDGNTRIYIIDEGGLNLNSKGEYKVKLMSKDKSENVVYKEILIIVYDNYDFSYYYEILLILGLVAVIIFSIIKVK